MLRMQVIFILLFSIIVPSHTLPQSKWYESDYFNTAFLSQSEKVRDALIHDGFTSISFKSLDGYDLNGLIRIKEHATHNVILTAGFYPGLKEGMATFVALLPDDCNIFFIDARGHGQSSGPFWRSILWYGQQEYKDIIGALDVMCAHNKLPNMLIGVCIGAFHSSRALIHLAEEHQTDAYNIKGFVFDSGFGSVADLMWVPTTHITEKTLPSLMVSTIYTKDTKKEVKNRWLFRAAALVTSACASTATYIASPFLKAHDDETKLFNKMHMISTPILFIHCKNDTYTPFEDVHTLANEASCASCWWLDHSEHACHHLKYKQEYKGRLLEFINNYVHTGSLIHS